MRRIMICLACIILALSMIGCWNNKREEPMTEEIETTGIDTSTSQTIAYDSDKPESTIETSVAKDDSPIFEESESPTETIGEEVDSTKEYSGGAGGENELGERG